jgi:HAD superfamily hydrolase (TIGR01490 family)
MSARKPAALFDFDGTLTRRDTMAQFLLHVLRLHPPSVLELPQLTLLIGPFVLGWVSKERIKTAGLRLLKRVPAAKREGLVRSFHQEHILPRYLPAGLERVRWHREQGHTLVLVSASLDSYLGEVVRHLGFDLLVATRTALDPIPAVLGPNCYGPEKVERLRALPLWETTDWKASWAYSDHLSDLPMLRLCGHPVATTPKPDLRRVAEREGWEIADWG